MNVYAAAHPGKLGDCLYCLPLLRYLSKRDNVLFDFYTSEYCRPLTELFEYQSCIRKVYISEEYKLDNFGCGAQPWFVPIPNEYEKTYQLGFQRTPDQMLHQFIAAEQGIREPLAVEYEFPNFGICLPENYICIAPRGNSNYNNIFDKLPFEKLCVIVGGKGDYRGYGADFTGKSLLETCYLLSKSQGFIGLMSSQLVLANGFPIPRIALGGHHSDMRHAVKYHLNHYPHDPVTVEDILKLL